ncbi:hypothetical protein [Demequina sp. NBRC 110055]|uniref:hypothetical protein n=1 Tax=Demequina sp. NBRC 110055 TaxID=1570344 RepID=UPI001184E40B|nr:hypothetical protein [Demequina sp. NBRC 110055]
MFVLDRSTLDGSESMVLTSRYGTEWQGIECDSTGMTVTRGGSRQGLGTKIDVGSLNASFVDGVNPVDDPDLRPGVPVRLLAEVEVPTSIATFIAPANPFTYSATAIWDVPDTDIPKRITLEVRVSRATDVRWASNGYALEDYQRIPANTWTTVTGLVAGGWNRPNLYFNRGDFPYEGDGDQPVSLEIRNVSAVELGSPLFTGSIDKFRVNYDKQDDRSYISMTAFDGVARIASTPRNGADGPERWQARFDRLLKSCPVPYVAPDQIEEDDWDNVENLDGAEQIGEWTGSWYIDPGYPEILNDNVSGAACSRVIPVEAGRVYYLRVGMAVETGSPLDATASIDAPLTEWQASNGTFWVNRSVIFRPMKDTVTLTVQAPAGRRYQIDSTLIDVRPRALWAAPVVHDSDLASHLDIAANSADVGWYLDREGTVRISEGGGDPVAHFSDVHDEGDPLHVCYTEADVSYDTAEATNTIRFANHGRKDNGTDIPVPATAAPATLPLSTWTTWQIWDTNVYPMTASKWEVSVDLRVSHPTSVYWWHPEGGNYGFVAWPGRWYTVTNGPTGNLLSRSFDFRPTNGVPGGTTVSLYTRNLSVRAVGKYEADDTTLGAFIDHAAAATWGERAEELETAIETGTPYDSLGEGIEDQAAWLAERLLARYSRPEPTVSKVTFDAMECPDIAPQLDIHTKVSVTHRGLTQTSTIVGIDHDIRPDDWFITITLQEARN